jgi:hypothetical protein
MFSETGRVEEERRKNNIVVFKLEKKKNER